MFKYVILLLLSTTSALKVYYVTPDHGVYNDTANITGYPLNYYLMHSTEYICSKTQMHFLPGNFNLLSNFTIWNISHFLLTGNQSVIHCSTNSAVLFYNSTNVTVHGLTLKGCATHASHIVTKTSSLSLQYCSNITISYLKTDCIANNYGILAINVFGNSTIRKINSNRITIKYNLSKESLNTIHLAISHFTKTTTNCSSKYSAVHITLKNYCSIVKINLTNTVFYKRNSIFYRSDIHDGLSSLYISKVSFVNITKPKGTKAIYIVLYNRSNRVYTLANRITLMYCNFINVSALSYLILVQSYQDGYTYSKISISRSSFHHNSYATTLVTKTGTESQKKPQVIIYVSYVKIYSIKQMKCVLDLVDTNLRLHHLVLTNANSNQSIIETKNSQIMFKQYVEFSMITTTWCIVIEYIKVDENTLVNFTGNRALGMFTLPSQKRLYTLYEQKMQNNFLCVFQFVSRKGNLDERFYQGEKFNYSILFEHNKGAKLASTKYAFHHCGWVHDSAFTLANSKDINQQYISFNENNFPKRTDIKKTSMCKNNHIDYIDDITGPIYPGQTLKFSIYVKKAIIFQINDLSNIACKIYRSNINDKMQAPKNTCTSFLFNVHHKSGRGCELYLQGMLTSVKKGPLYLDYMKFVDAYYVMFKPCPQGFVLNSVEGKCICDPLLRVLDKFSPIRCNINDQTILRPANAWISATTINNTHMYDVSLHCPFDFCLPYSSNLVLSKLDDQCQYHRVGVLCGYCPRNLSSVFGSSQCKSCSNLYLLIIVPITIAGLIMVLLLFSLNFTVTDGDVNGIILYANIVSINNHLFFSKGGNFNFSRVSISLLNLDLGIETCFYNGMNDYSKLWLQLVFPFYLFVLVIFFIIASRHSSKLQRLTARRVLPVLATLILLSFTKMLRTTSTALFFYSEIIHLPSDQTTLVWSVDSRVTLFGIKFAILFAVCLILFLILLQFIMVLIFTRTLSRFKIINRFKPLLDAYQGPYKSRFYYWTGLQLLIRTVFFGLLALSSNTNIMISTIVIGTIILVQGVVNPFKSRRQNIHELLILLNLQALFAVTQYAVGIHILISLAISQFVIILLNHVRLHLCSRFLNSSVSTEISKVAIKLETAFLNPGTPKSQENEMQSTDTVHIYNEFQEPLIEEFDA